MRMHHDGVRAINYLVALRLCPAGVLIVLSVLQLLQKAARRPNIFPNATADHAEEVIPFSRLTRRTETTIVITCVNGLAVRAWNLPPKDRGDLRIAESFNKRPQPMRTLRGCIGVQENSEIRSREAHALIHYSAGVIFMGLYLNKMSGRCRLDQSLRSVA